MKMLCLSFYKAAFGGIFPFFN